MLSNVRLRRNFPEYKLDPLTNIQGICLQSAWNQDRLNATQCVASGPLNATQCVASGPLERNTVRGFRTA